VELNGYSPPDPMGLVKYMIKNLPPVHYYSFKLKVVQDGKWI